ncbi:peptidyl-tRNA hydrolase ICT1, mitochondrial [Archocentrus centrarchus]|uniref:peptidyl-tRNA hydrolase ICT1, mitochondrial n=1 Tax=Archocentrus centrarchus TaxID=63155 RepID=UPI0011E9D82D|nr:peptidyl-tRNA hydrolase ICT1, mitochondrial [Archocentrus centrarchus]
MATSMARRSCVFCCTGINAIRQHVPPLNALLGHMSNTLQSSVSYGTRETDGTQEAQVHIPVERLTVSYSRSSGPGGQHVNKVSTKAEVRFHVQTAEWIPEDVRKKILEKNKNRITKAGELLVTSELSRSQQRNLSDCIQKISTIIAEASEKPHEPTAEDIALRAARSEKRNKERLRQKKIHSVTKQSRRVDFD